MENTERALAESPNHLITLALERGADPDTLSKLLDLQQRWETGEARKAYVIAMTAFKQECPSVLKKGDKVDFTSSRGRTAYNYANLGSIVQEITAPLGKHELSASWNTAQDDRGNVTVTCHVTHIAGYRESTSLTGPQDDSGNKNRIQAIGSTVTYLQRYTLLAALGMATGEDDDGRGGATETKGEIAPPQEKQAETTGPQSIDSVIEKVEQEKGKKKDGSEWIKYYIHADGKKFSTFDKKIAESAKLSMKTSMICTILYKVTKYGNEVESMIMPEGQHPEELPL